MPPSFAFFALRPVAGAGNDPATTPSASAWRLSAATAARWAVAVAVLMSTQYLVQPFVWTNWPVDEVLLGWLEVVRHRVTVALSIALALVVATRASAHSPSARAGVVAAAILCGAAAGELALVWSGTAGERTDPTSVLGRVLQWTGLAACVAGMYFLWVRSNEARMAARASELARSTAEALLVQTQLQSLRHQIEPHFLFNTLATIRRLKETRPADGTQLLRHLLDYLRSTMPASERRTTLGDEVDLVGSYLAIVAMRMSGLLRYEFDVPVALRGHPCPPLTLATLVENAVKHGITPAPEGGSIVVRATRVDGALEIVVADTGVGIPESGTARIGGAGIGLANIRARLRALHGAAASLSLSGNVPHGVRAVIRLPIDDKARR